jgi:hypothetical protein
MYGRESPASRIESHPAAQDLASPVRLSRPRLTWQCRAGVRGHDGRIRGES